MPPAYNVPPEDLDGEMQAELDAEERQDEILAHAGIYDLPLRHEYRWKILVIIGAVLAVLGFLFWFAIGGLEWPSSFALPSAWGSALSIFLVVLGLGCLVAGIVFAFQDRGDDSSEMEPIR